MTNQIRPEIDFLHSSNKARMYGEKKAGIKEFRIYGIQQIHHSATIKAKTLEEALKKADEHHEDYDWDECHIGDWTYES